MAFGSVRAPGQPPPVFVRTPNTADTLENVLLDDIVVRAADPDAVHAVLRRPKREPADSDVGASEVDDIRCRAVVNQGGPRRSGGALRANGNRRCGGPRKGIGAGKRWGSV